MPAYTSLPNSGDNNTNLKTLSIDGYSLSPNFDSDILTYESYVPSTVNEITISATAASSKSTVTGTGKVNLNEEDTDITIKVQAETGDTKNYTITIKKSGEPTVITEDPNTNTTNDNNTTNETETTTESSTATLTTILNNAALTINNNSITNVKYNTSFSTIQNNLTRAGATSISIVDSKGNKLSGSNLISTGSKMTITTSNDSKTYSFVITGDTSGDGNITILDLLQVQKHIKGDKKLTGDFLLSADTSKDGKVTILDLLQVQKHIKGDKKL